VVVLVCLPGVAEGASWFDAVTIHGQVEGGILANPARPADGANFGAFFGDRANQAQFDQLSVMVARPVDRASSAYEIGFSMWLLYGADARYYNIAGISDRIFTGREQIMPAAAHLDVHLPWVTRRGLDMQAGIFTSPMGVESLDPMARPFYSLAYTTEFSTPFEHVGVLFQWHLSPVWDVQFGVDAGNQVSFGRGNNNGEPDGYFGVTANGLLGGRLNFTYLSRVGAEDSVRALGPVVGRGLRYWNDVNGTYQIDKALTATAEFNVLHDAALRDDTWSVVTWLSEQVTPSVTLNYRGELYRDNTGAIVTGFLNDTAYMRSILGEAAPVQTAPGTTYGALTLGATWHPALGRGVRAFALRPEIRFDRALNGTTPFNDLRNTGRFTFGGDAVLGF